MKSLLFSSTRMLKDMNCFDPRDLPPRQVQFPSTAKLCYKGARAWWELPHLFLSLQAVSTPADCMLIHPTPCTICLAKGIPWGGPRELATPKTYRTPRTTTSRAAGTPLPSPPCPPFSMVITITCCTISPRRGPSRNAVSRAPNNCFRARDPPTPPTAMPGASPAMTRVLHPVGCTATLARGVRFGCFGLWCVQGKSATAVDSWREVGASARPHFALPHIAAAPPPDHAPCLLCPSEESQTENTEPSQNCLTTTMAKLGG